MVEKWLFAGTLIWVVICALGVVVYAAAYVGLLPFWLLVPPLIGLSVLIIIAVKKEGR